MSDLELMTLKGRVPSNRLDWLKHTLIDGYRSAGGQASSDSIDLYTAIYLLWLAKGPFRKRLLDWPERTQLIVEHTEHLVKSIPSGSTVSLTATGDRC